MGMFVTVYRQHLVDSTNGSESSKVNGFCVTNVEGPFEPNDRYPAAELVLKDFGIMLGAEYIV